MSQCGGEAVRFNWGFDATWFSGDRLCANNRENPGNTLAPQEELRCMISLYKTTGDILAVATLGASPVRVNLEVSGNRFILLSNCNRTV
ncbi:MAG: hypothetical protein V7K50_23115 [Nostoc sp.]|uniref:hypothetical protein n=1 Tax=Nostoc sp. TaxID=1180 RepID=UPI002FF5EA23